MSRLHEPLQRHIHGELCHEVNKVIIAIKINHYSLEGKPKDQVDKIMKARERTPAPTWEQIADLLSRVREEMDQCKEPYKRY